MIEIYCNSHVLAPEKLKLNARRVVQKSQKNKDPKLALKKCMGFDQTITRK